MTQKNLRFTHYDGSYLRLQDKWILSNYRELRQEILQADQSTHHYDSIDFSALEQLDTAGAEQLCELITLTKIETALDLAKGLSAERKALLRTVAQALRTQDNIEPTKKNFFLGDVFARIGNSTQRFWQQFLELTAFVGLTLETLFLSVLRPSRWRITSIVAQLEETAFNAVPIIFLLTFLVGAVIAFLGATILTEFGATIYTVNLVGFSFLREFAVLLTAILMAGRTASAFTAQIGSMKANEEIDALRAQGLNPMLILVIPRVIAMLFAMPILTFIGMLAGILGGALVCALTLDISPAMFLDIFRQDVSIRHFFLGMAKAPIFAFLIAVIGCLQGFKVTGSAQSVGERTTAAVVHSIFIVILLDAMAALFYMEMGW